MSGTDRHAIGRLRRAPAPAAGGEAAPAADSAATAAEGDGLSIAYLNKMGDNPWFIDEVAGARARADSLGIEFFNQDLQFDSDLALNSMDTYISSGIDGIVIVVPDTKIGPAVIQKAKEANVPLIAVDDNILDADGAAAPFVGFDAATIGTQVGETIAQYYKDDGWDKLEGAVVKAVSIEDQDLEVCNIRTDNAAAAVLANIPGFTEADIIHLPYDNTMVGGMDSMAPIVTANPDVTNWLLFSCNDDGVLGAWRALSNAGVDAKNVIGVGINGQLAGEEWAKGEPTGLRASLFVRAGIHGETAIQLINDFIKDGKEIPARTIVPGTVITAENYQEVMGGGS
ncbi:MAG: substrate-binding domain-containing protein [Anaerolineales bacterium]|nr:substrate-binding domain-containing protein [Anaerolineales bacterium]